MIKVWLDVSALQTSKSNFFLPIRFIESLHTLNKAGIQVGWNEHNITDGQRNILMQEELHPDFTSPSQAECKISLADNSGNYNIEVFNSELSISQQPLPGWPDIAKALLLPVRYITEERKTRETDINLSLNLDGTGNANIDTGLNFFNHMLEQIARHGHLDMELKVEGDLKVDEHHTIEDVAIVLGGTINKALGDKGGLERYGFVLPMDESEAKVSIDLSGRPYLRFDGEFKREYVGDFPTEMAEHFFHSLAMQMNATLHISVNGSNEHHKLEACFKGFARALKHALKRDPESLNILPTSKGKL